MIVTAAGWTLPDLNDAILLIEAVQMGLGQLDRSLTRLIKAGGFCRKLDGKVSPA